MYPSGSQNCIIEHADRIESCWQDRPAARAHASSRASHRRRSRTRATCAWVAAQHPGSGRLYAHRTEMRLQYSRAPSRSPRRACEQNPKQNDMWSGGRGERRDCCRRVPDAPKMAMSELKLPMLKHSLATLIRYWITCTRTFLRVCCTHRHSASPRMSNSAWSGD